MKRIPLLLISSSIIFIIIAFIALKLRAPATPPPPTPTQPLPLPTLNQAPQTVSFTPAITFDQQPITLNLYQIRNIPYTPESLAAILNFTTPPNIIDVANARQYYWSKDPIGKLTVQDQPLHLFFQSNLPLTPEAAPHPDSATQLIFNFLSTHQLINNNLPLKLDTTTYFKANEYNLTSARSVKDANLIELELHYALDNYPYYSSTSTLSSITAKVTKDGIYSITISPPPTLDNLGKVTIISPHKAFQLLQQNLGTLVASSPNYYTETTPDISFSKATIKNYQIVYIQTPNTNRLTPSYRFDGTAPEDTHPKVLHRITYLVPALAE